DLRDLTTADGLRPDTTLEQIDAFNTWLRDLEDAVAATISVVRVLSSVGLEPRNALDDLERCIKLVQLSQHSVVGDSSVVTEHLFEATGIQTLRAAYRESKRLQQLESELLAKVDARIAGTPVDVETAVEEFDVLESALERFSGLASSNFRLIEIAALNEWCRSAKSSLCSVEQLSRSLAAGPIDRPRNYEEFRKAATLVQLARHRAVAEEDCLSPAMFGNEGKRTYQQAQATSEELNERGKSLERSFHLPSVPEVSLVKEITKTLRKYRRSPFRFFSAEYRRARAKLDEFVAVGVKHTLDDWIRSLEDFDTFSADKERFRNEDAIAKSLAEGFRGIDTDWDILKLRLDWAHTVRQYGLNYETACGLLQVREKFIPGVSNIELKRSLSAFKEDWIDGDYAPALSISSINTVEFGQLSQEIADLANASEKILSDCNRIGVPKDWSLSDLRQFLQLLRENRKLGEAKSALRNNQVYRIKLGTNFKGEATDWKQLETTFNWVQLVKSEGGDFDLMTRLLEERSKRLRNFDTAKAIALVQDVRRLIDSIPNAMESFSYASEFSISSINAAEIGQLSQKIGYFADASEKILTDCKRIGVPKDWSLSDLQQLMQLLRENRKLGEEKSAMRNNQEYRSKLGTNFEGEATDWKQLEATFNWVQLVKSEGGDFDLVTRLLEERSKQLRNFDTSKAIALVQEVRKLIDSMPNTMEDFSHTVTLAPVQLLDEISCQRNVIGVGLDSSYRVGCKPNTTIVDITQRLETAGEIESLNNQIGDQSLWGVLSERGIYEESVADPDSSRAAIDWFTSLYDELQRLPKKTLVGILEHPSIGEISDLCDAVEQRLVDCETLLAARARIGELGKLSEDWLPVGVVAVLAGHTQAQAVALLEVTDHLPAWSNLCRAWYDCEQLQLGRFCELAIDGDIDLENLASSYELSILEVVAEAAFQESGMLEHASGKTLEAIRKDFQVYDLKLRELARLEIASKAADRRVPSGNSRGRVAELTELALIRHESQKQTRHCRIRDLLTRAGEAVQALKPCLMMSPLSVSRFVPPGALEFDLVIMDEASQIKPEDAIGTILRAKQLVVVGDPKQLPPTSFFDRLDEEIDDEEATQLDNTESVLEAAMKVFQPFRRLRWHYRSKHESLIRFSNSSFYEDDLVVFPSPTGEDGTYGIRHVFVEGATCAGGLNQREAEVVVEEIVRHAITKPDESLGVGTFNKKQAELISELLEKRCESDSAAAIAIEKLKQHEEESLFIKNLENLQGDERDVIFVCYTYGKDPASNRLMQRFGPINTQKGWRRLNVLVTRSRNRMVVFSSIMPGDIVAGPDKSRGVNAYKDFLNYAITGTLQGTATISGRGPESPFEEAVCRKIEQMGLDAVPQVGVAGFFIDIGVRQREGDRSFLLGIECDGATYHSAKSARDRDRLREEIIRSRGWNIHRIWSTDWFLNQRAEEERLELAISQQIR
ncbi:MAG: AAA domain-containing protein, partial [bacterium]|nr:AAA domain-containing protein [bacterium]